MVEMRVQFFRQVVSIAADCAYGGVSARQHVRPHKRQSFSTQTSPDRGDALMFKSTSSKLFVTSTLFAVLAAAAIFGTPAQRASAQSAATYVNAVDLDIAPAEMAAFLVAIKENGAATVKEPGCRQFDIMVEAKNPNHVFLYEIYDNEAALTSHR